MIEKSVPNKSFSYILEQFRGLKGLESSCSSPQNHDSLKYPRLESKWAWIQLRNYEMHCMGFIDHDVLSSSTWGHCHNHVILNPNLPLLPFITSMDLLRKRHRLPLKFWSDGSMWSMDTFSPMKSIYRCVFASQWEGLSVHLSVSRSVGWSVRPSVTSYFWIPRMRKLNKRSKGCIY